ncbi:MAG: hypothetical protein IT178_09605 [Acidobacteria bacterium]|nr:hypothetical protein [Acidobacteriota bacterium]
MESIHRFRPLVGAGLLAVAALSSASCASELTRTGSSPAYIIIDSIEGASGADPEEFGVPLLSDVATNGSTFNDLAVAAMRIAMKNQGAVIPTAPSNNVAITLNRYRVTFRRADGRNTAGVDVPHPFDGAVTATIPAQGVASIPFEIVRHQAKVEQPLRNLRGGGGSMLISTLAEIEFYGRDQVGNEVIARGTLQVNFGDFADPKEDE